VHQRYQPRSSPSNKFVGIAAAICTIRQTHRSWLVKLQPKAIDPQLFAIKPFANRRLHLKLLQFWHRISGVWECWNVLFIAPSDLARLYTRNYRNTENTETYLGFISFLTKILKMNIFIYTSTHFYFSSFHLFHHNTKTRLKMGLAKIGIKAKRQGLF
jgi:hypothetical protein